VDYAGDRQSLHVAVEGPPRRGRAPAEAIGRPWGEPIGDAGGDTVAVLQDEEGHDESQDGAGDDLHDGGRPAQQARPEPGGLLLQLLDEGLGIPLDIGGGEAQGTLDRKSTRLNSSHVKISYAVFCLKK